MPEGYEAERATDLVVDKDETKTFDSTYSI